jgi:hypothetical protein
MGAFGFFGQPREEAEAARDALEDEARDNAAMETAWDKIDGKIRELTIARKRDATLRFTLRELKMLRQFRRKHA